MFIARTDHPYYDGLQLVIWRLGDRYSFDALDPQQIVGSVVLTADPARWFEAILGTWKP